MTNIEELLYLQQVVLRHLCALKGKYAFMGTSLRRGFNLLYKRDDDAFYYVCHDFNLKSSADGS